MGRRNKRRDEQGEELRDPRVFTHRRVEEHPDGEWVVQKITGSSSIKSYRCPGCDQLIPPATPHTVAWPFDQPSGEESRRHWHNPCWQNRNNRGPRILRGKGAPRY